MSRAFTSTEHDLLRSPDLKVNVLATFYLDIGTYYFCDEQSGIDLSDGTTTWIGANAFATASEIRATQDMQAEQVTLLLDGNRMAQAGVSDPARVLADIMGYLYQQRRVDYSFAFRYSYSQTINMIIPAYAGKINTCRLIDRSMSFPQESSSQNPVTNLEIVLDSLAARYNRSTYRLRAHNDQLEIDATDNFYSFTVDVAANERSVYWGKNAPFGSPVLSTVGGTTGGGTTIGGGSSGGGFGGGISGGGGDGLCVAANTPILLPNNVRRNAGDLIKGELIWAPHADNPEGSCSAYPILDIRKVADQDVVKAIIEGQELRATPDHRVYVMGDWRRMRFLGSPDGQDEIVQLTTGSGTFISNGILSHNMKMITG